MSAALPPLPSLPYDTDTFAVTYGTRLLLWVSDRAQGAPATPVPCQEFAVLQSFPASVVWSLAGHLSGQGLVAAEGPRETAPVVTLWPVGADQARRLQIRRASPAERGRHARHAVLTWIYAQQGREPLSIGEFFDSAAVFFLGEALSRGEVARTLSYLAESELIICEGPEFHHGVGLHVALTPLGIDALMTGADIGRFVAEQRKRDQYTHIEAETVNYAQGDFHTQVEVHTALTPADLARLIHELAPALDLDDRARAALLDQASGLTHDHGTPQARREDQRSRMERMRDLLGGGSETVGRQVVLDMIGQALGRLLG